MQQGSVGNSTSEARARLAYFLLVRRRDQLITYYHN